MDISFYLKLFLRRLHYVAIFAVLGAVVGFTVAAILPATYSATARLVVQGDQIPENLAESTVQVAGVEQMQIIQQRIMTRASLIDMANRLQLYGPNPPPPDAIVADLQGRLYIDTKGPPPRTQQTATMVTVYFSDRSPQRAAQVTNEVVTMIQNEDVAIRTSVARDTLDFFEQEVSRLDTALSQANQRLLQFRSDNRGTLPDDLEMNRTRQGDLQTQLTELNTREAQLQAARRTMVETYESSGQIIASNGEVQATTPRERQLQELRNQLSAAQAIYSAQNPRILMLQNQIASLERASLGAGGASGLTPYQVQLASYDTQLSEIAQNRQAVESSLTEVNGLIAQIGANDASLEALARDRDNARLQYDQAVARRAQAATGDLIEAMSKGQKVTLIEQASVPRDPVSPNRTLIALGGLGGGLFLGVALVALLELLNRSIRRPVELTSKLGITPFASLPLIRTDSERRRRTAMVGGVLAVVVVGVPVMLLLLNTYVMPLDQLPGALALRLRDLIG
ncbi:GumC family protein [Frigidibacter sp. MR17.24]|uniref:GumC family protein n=1 Tax=Frigidibacter sp. MR17.24 TaxID=3127345 RepID=UPI003012B14A